MPLLPEFSQAPTEPLLIVRRSIDMEREETNQMNTVVLSGRICADPELRTTPNGHNVCSFRLAVPRTKEVTDFINCVAWDKTAEVICKYMPKGMKIMVSGDLRSRTYETQEGAKREVHEVVVFKAEFADSKPNNSAPQQAPQQTSTPSPAPQTPAAVPQSAPTAKPAYGEPGYYGAAPSSDDDYPF